LEPKFGKTFPLDDPHFSYVIKLTKTKHCMAELVWKRQEGRFYAQTSVQTWWAKGVLTIKSRNPEFGSRTLAYILFTTQINVFFLSILWQ
jgi:hypothetical protein